jgi:hypothetical protein
LLEVPTVFVLGAGASAPYGFPTGFDLSKNIVSGLTYGPMLGALRDIGGIPSEELLHFRKEFYESGKNSVDAFLEHRDDLLAIGKLVTARALIEKEVVDELFTFQNSWLELHQVTKESLRIAAENIKIIHEDITDGRDKDFLLAKQLLAEADQIILLGFGYNSTNVGRLGIANLPEGKIKGTCIALGGSGETTAKEVTNGRVELLGGDCTHFVREVMRWK